MNGWFLVDIGNKHVVPRCDIIDHTFKDKDLINDEVCICGPTVELRRRDDAPDFWLFIHHSLDGREASDGGPVALSP